MATLLYIESSPRKERSHSIAVARAFLDAYEKANPDDTVDTIDLWDLTLPEFDGATINAKYQVMHGDSPTGAQQQAWGFVKEHFERFNSADKYLLSVPMWNFSVPYKLKHYIDVITQPGLAFNMTDDGFEGLIDGKAAVMYARGGSYGGEAGQAMDYQKRYLDLWLGFVGITDVASVICSPTANPDKASDARAMAIKEAGELGGKF